MAQATREESEPTYMYNVPTSQVLQNLANHILFKKEAHMEVFNEFLQQNFESIREHALQLSGMGPYFDGDAIEYITFLKESYKHRVHSLLWNSQDKMAVYAASTRYLADVSQAQSVM